MVGTVGEGSAGLAAGACLAGWAGAGLGSFGAGLAAWGWFGAGGWVWLGAWGVGEARVVETVGTTGSAEVAGAAAGTTEIAGSAWGHPFAVTFLPLMVTPFLVHVLFPIVFPGVVAPAVLWSEEDDKAYKDEYAGADESPEFHLGIEVLYEEAAADEYKDEPGGASEIMP